LYRLLEKSTAPVMQMYVADMRNSDLRIENAARGGGDGGGDAMIQDSPSTPTPTALIDGSGSYRVEVASWEETTFQGITYVFALKDPKNNHWTTRKKYADFECLHKLITPYLEDLRHSSTDPPIATLPGKFTSLLRPTKAEIEERSHGLRDYLFQVLDEVASLTDGCKKILCDFLEVKLLYDPPTKIVHAEEIPNHFLILKQQFIDYATSINPTAHVPGDKIVPVLKQKWGVEASVKILEAHALLQRMATLLGLTLEINHFFGKKSPCDVM